VAQRRHAYAFIYLVRFELLSRAHELLLFFSKNP